MSSIPMITLEEHFTSKAVKEIMVADGDPLLHMPSSTLEKLDDVRAVRIASMDASNVAIQVISHTPAQKASVEVLRKANDELAEHVKAHPTRYRGFAILPMGEPEAATAELERCVRELGFVGALVDNHTLGRFYDGPEYDGFWTRAQDLDVPIYLHPTWPSDEMVRANYSGGGLKGRPLESAALGAFGWGWHSETGLHVMRLLAARVFDRFPKLKVVVGHSGEMIPYMFARINGVVGRWGLARGFEEVMHSNIWITTSGMFDLPSFVCLTSVMPLERVLMSLDYPFSENAAGRKYVEELEKAGIITGTDLEAFAYKNAEKLLKISIEKPASNEQ